MSRTAHPAASHAAGIDFDQVATRYVAAPALLWATVMLAMVFATAIVASVEPMQASVQQPVPDAAEPSLGSGA